MEMFQYDFMIRAFIASTAIAFIAPILGLMLILRKQSLLSDTLAHVSLSGVALGYMLGVDPTWTTIFLVATVAVLLEYLRKIYENYSDISIAMLMSGGMALALLLLSRIQTASSIESYLFGSIVTITGTQVWMLVIMAMVIVVGYLIFQRVFYVVSFDEDTAYTAGLPTQLISILFSVLTGVAISVMMPIAGSLLVAAIIIMPSAIAMRLSKSFNGVILVSIVLSLISLYGGLGTSYYLDTPPGATIVMILLTLFAIEMLVLKIIKIFWTKKLKS